MSKIKILFCSEYYYPNLGGVQNHIRLITKYLPKNKFNIEIATSYDSCRKKKIIDGNKINEFKIQGNLAQGYKGKIREYQDFLLKKKFDIIFFYAAQQWSFDLSLPIIEKINAKKIFCPCGFSKLKNLYYSPYFFLLKEKINKYDRLIFFSKNYQDYKLLKKIYNNKIKIICNAGIKSKKKINTKKNSKRKDFLKILNVGKISIMKNQLYLLLAVLFIKRKLEINFYYNNNNFFSKIVILIGQLVEKIRNKKLFINFYYNNNQNKIIKSYQENDLFVFTSLVECSPLVIYDAAVNSLPFISKSVGNVPEIARKSKSGRIYKNIFHFIKLINNFKITKKEKTTYDFGWKKQLEKYKKEFLSISQSN